MTQRDFENGFGARNRGGHGEDAHDSEHETANVSPPAALDRDATGRPTADAGSEGARPMGNVPENAPPDDDAPLSEVRMALLRTRREALRELQHRGSAVFAAEPAASFAGFAALIRAVMPALQPERDNLSTRLGIHPAAIAWLIDDTLSWYDVDRDAIVTLGWALGLARQTFLDLLVGDLNRAAEAGGATPRSIEGWVEVTTPVLWLWDEVNAPGDQGAQSG